jgi:hypothetical protein
VHNLGGTVQDVPEKAPATATASRSSKAANSIKHLLREHLGIDALISLPKLPPGWEQHDPT